MTYELDLLPVLTVVRGPMRGTSCRLRPGRCEIGRDTGADIVLDDVKVSRWHATVELADGLAVLTDCGSTNGTWVNGRRLDRVTELCDGDRIRLGQVEMSYHDPALAVTEPVADLRYAPPTEVCQAGSPPATAVPAAALAAGSPAAAVSGGVATSLAAARSGLGGGPVGLRDRFVRTLLAFSGWALVAGLAAGAAAYLLLP